MFKTPASRRPSNLAQAPASTHPHLCINEAPAHDLAGRFCRRHPESLLAHQLKADVPVKEPPKQRGVRSNAAFVTLGHRLLD